MKKRGTLSVAAPSSGTGQIFFFDRRTTMNATVNESCIGCGLCAGNCPEVFSMGDDGFAHGGEVPDGMLDAAQSARDECPVSAISIG